jgi:hypothetical protein
VLQLSSESGPYPLSIAAVIMRCRAIFQSQ